MIKTILELDLQEVAVITGVRHTDEGMQRRLLDLGFCEGAPVMKVLTTRGANPAAYKVRGSVIALRSCDAQYISVEAPPI
ncbi:MAG: ferrous iron transport protein A [Turicibacter sp.]|nr:ferrous iron transport protein A [Turicibacter sp.]